MADGEPFKIAVLASGGGTNLQAIIDRFAGGGGIELAAVASDKPGAQALERAQAAGVETAVFERSSYPSRDQRDAAMAEWVASRGAELVVLAGYMQLLGGAFIGRFPERVINVHPALLPSFPGLDAIGQALAHGVKVTGVTVHLVDEGMDTGPIVLQRSLPLTYTRSIAEVEAQIHQIEHQLLPDAIALIAAGKVRIDPDNPRVVRVDE